MELNPSGESNGFHRGLVHALAVGLVLGLLNAIKPPIMDDGTYFEYASHIALHPLDPYGFETSWLGWMRPAIEVLTPPVVPYWLALAVAWCGGSWVVLKLWMIPWCVLWSVSVYALLRRWSGALVKPMLWYLGLSAVVLPACNWMLDIPMFGLLTGSLAVLARACDRTPRDGRAWAGAVLAGLLLGVAMQTKYNALIGLPVLALYGWVLGGVGLAACSVLVAAAVFAGWEGLMFAKYGLSHFWLVARLNDQFAGQGILGAPAERWGNLLILGGVCAPFAALVAWAKGVRRPRVVALAVIATVVPVVSVFWPPLVAERVFAVMALILLAFMAWLVVGESKALVRARSWARSPAFWLIAWLLMEIALTLLISPFPAARRYLGTLTVLTLLAAHVASRGISPGDTAKFTTASRTLWLIVPLSAALGLVCFANDFAVGVDIERAYRRASDLSQKAAATDAAGVASARQPVVWNLGGWSSFYFASRLGMTPLAPDRSVIRRGDVVIVPVRGLGRHSIEMNQNHYRKLGEVDEDFAWPAIGVEGYYGGGVPIARKNLSRVNLLVIQSLIDQPSRMHLPVSYVANWALLRRAPLPVDSVRLVMDAVIAFDESVANRLRALLLANGPRVLVPASELENPRARYEAALLLGRCESPEARSALERLARDADPRVATAAAAVMRRASSQPVN